MAALVNRNDARLVATDCAAANADALSASIFSMRLLCERRKKPPISVSKPPLPDKAATGIVFTWGRRPQTPGIYRFRARMLLVGRLTPPHDSGRWVGAPVASLRCRTLRPGEASISPPGSLSKNCLPNRPSAGYKYSCSGSAPLAGFEVSADGRFSGVHRGRVK